MSGYGISVPDLLTRLRRIEGQVRGLQRMIERDDARIDILTQVKSVTKALDCVAVGVLAQHLRDRVASGSDAEPARIEEMINDVTYAVAKLIGR